MIKYIARLVLVLNSNIKKTSIASGIAWGVLLGLVPAGNFFWIILLLASFFFNHHHGLKLVTMVIFIILSPVYALLLDQLGWAILHIESLQPMFTSMYNTAFVPFTKFNNTLVAGGLAAGIVLFFPVYFLCLPAIHFYRNKLAPKVRNSKLVQAIVKIKFFGKIDRAIANLTD